MSADPMDQLQPIEVGWTSQRLALRSVEEDWTGMTNPVERRKLQNRLNQRARRQCAHIDVGIDLRLKSARNAGSREKCTPPQYE